MYNSWINNIEYISHMIIGVEGLRSVSGIDSLERHACQMNYLLSYRSREGIDGQIPRSFPYHLVFARLQSSCSVVVCEN